MLKQMLIHLAFDKKNSTVAFRAIELLMQQPRIRETSDLDGLTKDELLQLDEELDAVYLKHIKPKR